MLAILKKTLSTQSSRSQKRNTAYLSEKKGESFFYDVQSGQKYNHNGHVCVR